MLAVFFVYLHHGHNPDIMKRLTIFLLIALPFLFSCTQKEQEVRVESVSISPASKELTVGETLQLSATVSPSMATRKDITWSSSKSSVASVSASGLVTALGEGTTTITAAADGKKGECTITVSKAFVAVSEIKLGKTELTLYEGEEETLTASVLPDNATDKTITWTSSDKSIASVESGKVKAVKKGEAKITASAADGGVTASCNVVVRVAVESVFINKSIVSLNTGQSETLIATITPSDASEQSVIWASSDPAIATVEEGLVTAFSVGTAMITVKTVEGDKTACCEVHVLDGNPLYTQPEMIDMGLPSGLLWASFNLGASKPEEYGYYYSWGEIEPKDYYEWDNYKWGTDNSITKYCDNDGMISLLLEDDAARSNLSGEWRLPTTEECKELMDPANCSMEFTSINGVYVYVFTSKTTKNKLVFPKAGVMGIGLGDAGISGISGCWTSTLIHSNVYPLFGNCFKITGNQASISGYHRCAGLSIRPVFGKTPAIVPVTEITLDLSDVVLNIGSHETLTATVSPSYATNKQLVWTSSDSSIATISNGKIVAVSVGKTLITAATVDGSVSASCEVTVVQNTYDYPQPEAVDMGLSIKWASFNLGASAPEYDGYYYSWGEIEPKYNYRWTNYKWCDWYGNPNPTYSSTWNAFSLTKYTEPSSTLDNEDDPVQVTLGKGWRMPTPEEYQELTDYKKCTGTWTRVNDVDGYLITSRITGNSIFFPASGYMIGNSVREKGKRGYYWTNTLMYTEDAHYSCFTNISGSTGSNGERCDGFQIRPVYDDK